MKVDAHTQVDWNHLSLEDEDVNVVVEQSERETPSQNDASDAKYLILDTPIDDI